MQPRYAHRQPGWTLRLTTSGVAALLWLVARPSAAADERVWLLGGIALLLTVGWVWGRLMIVITDTTLHAALGPGWPRLSLPVRDIATVEVTRTGLSWGIGWIPRGWSWTVSGLDGVLIVRRDGRRLILGSDEPHALRDALLAARDSAARDAFG
jgi:hypothetical protein